jgi:hypothetical protein
MVVIEAAVYGGVRYYGREGCGDVVLEDATFNFQYPLPAVQVQVVCLELSTGKVLPHMEMSVWGRT